MATSSRDVELVVRARDEATKAINAVSDALNTLAGVQNTVSDSGARTDNTLDQLSRAFAGLQREASGLQALGTVAAQLDRMGAAIERLDQTNRQAGETAGAVAAKYETLAQAGAQLAAEAQRAKTALDTQRAAAGAAASEQAKLDRQVQAAANAYNTLVTAIRKAKAPTDEQTAAYRGARENLLQLLDQQERGSQALTQQSARATEAQKAYGLLDKQVQANATAQDKMGREVERANNAFAQTGATLERARAEFTQIQGVGEGAAHVLGDVALNQADISKAADKAAASLARVKEALAQQQSVGVGAPANNLFGTGPQGAATPTNTAREALVAGKDAVTQAAEAYKAAQQAVANLNREIRASEAPTQQQAAELLLAKQAAAEAKVALEGQVQALERLRAESRNYIATQQATVAVASAFKSALSGLPPIAPQLKRDTDQARSFRDVLNDLIQAFKSKYIPAVQEADKAHQGSNNSSRESLGLFQRLRGEVLGLAASYIGLQAALHGLSEVVNTYRALDQAQAQLSAAFDGDKNAVGQEMNFITESAEHLGVRLSLLSGEYAKLSIASKAAGYSTQGTRQIFLALAEGARVANLDTARYERVLYDFQKIIEFGKIDARDFNGVLRQIPGAAQAMADALGVSKDQIIRLQKAADGIPASEAVLTAFADKLRDRFAGQLPAALQTFNAELGRFQTSLEESQAIVARSGFMDALAATLHRLTEAMRSNEGQRFFQNLGRALGNLVSILPTAISHLGLLWTSFQLFLSLRVAEWFLGLVPAIAAFVTAVGGAAEASTALGIALGGLPLILGGLVFLATSVFGNFVSGVGQVDAALDAHALAMDKFKRDLDEAADKAGKLDQALAKASFIDLQADRKNLGTQEGKLLGQIQDQSYAFDGAGQSARFAQFAQQLDSAQTRLRDGKIGAEQYREELNRLAKAYPEWSAESAKAAQELADHLVSVRHGLDETNAAMRILQGGGTDADRALTGAAGAVDKLNGALNPAVPQAYADAIDSLKRGIPELARAAEAAQKTAQLDLALQQAKVAAKGQPNEKDLVAQAQSLHDRALDDVTGGAAVDSAARGDTGSRLLATGRRYLGDNGNDNRGALEAFFGTAGVKLDPEKAAWCAAFLQAVLANNGVAGPVDASGNPSVQARSFANFGTAVKGAEAQPGDIVLIKGGGSAISHVGLFDGYANGGNSVRILGGNQHGGQVNEETFPASQVAGIRRAPTAEEQTKFQLQGASEQEKFNKEVAAAVAKAVADTQAVGTSPRDAAIQRALDELDRQVAASGPTPDNPNRAKLRISDAQREKIAQATGSLYDAQRGEKETATVGELQKAYADLLNTGKQITANEEAADALRAKGFELVKNSAGAWEAVTAQGKQALDIETKIVELQRQRQQTQNIIGQGDQLKQLGGQLSEAYKEGDVDKVKELRAQIEAIKADLQSSLPTALAWAKALGDEKTVANLEQVQRTLHDVKPGLTNAAEINKVLGDGATSALDKSFESLGRFAAGFGKLRDVVKSTRDAFLQFAGDFLKQIAEMILKAELMKLLQQSGIGQGISGLINKATQTADAVDTGTSEVQINAAVAGSAAFASTAAIPIIGPELAPAAAATAEASVMTAFLPQVLAAVHHTGGIAGAVRSILRPVDPSVFASAARFHAGGIPGLGPNEVPAILEKNEEVLTRGDPRHILNGGAGGSQGGTQPQDIKIVNAFDHGEVLSQALNTSVGQRAIVNFVRNNSRAVNSALRGA